MITREELDDGILKKEDFCAQQGMQESVLLADASFIIFGGSRGGGKAQDEDATVKTPLGYVKIKDLEIGSEVTDPVGDTQFVFQIHEKGILDVHTLITDSGKFTKASTDHLWDVFVNENDRKIMTTSEIASALYNGYKIYIPTYNERDVDLNMEQIISCEYTGVANCRCISLTGEDGLYVTDFGIVTHNSFAIMLDILYDVHNPKFSAIVFRKNLKDLTKGGGLFDKAKLIYPALGGEEKRSALQFVFKSGAVVTFDHLENESDSSIESRFKGLEIPAIYIDEIDQIKFSTVFKLIQSNRNSLGIRNRLHGSCNPNSQSWLRKWIDYYVNNEGYIDPKKDGQVRYFYLYGSNVEDVYWGDDKESVYQQAKPFIDMAWKPEFADKYGMSKLDMIKSFVFIKGDLAENAKLIESDASYVANIAMGGKTEISRNFMGNWDCVDDGEEMVTRSNMEAFFDNTAQTTGRYYLSVDVAIQGKDNCVCVVWNGNHIVDIKIFPYFADGTALRAQVSRIMNDYNIREEDLFYDAVGNGSALLEFKQAYGVQPKAKTLNDDQSYADLKSQIMHRLGVMLQTTALSIDDNLAYKTFKYGGQEKISIREALFKEIKALKIDESSGKTVMLPKKARGGGNSMKKILGYSPDLLEAIAYGIIKTLLKKKGKSKKKGLQYL